MLSHVHAQPFFSISLACSNKWRNLKFLDSYFLIDVDRFAPLVEILGLHTVELFNRQEENWRIVLILFLNIFTINVRLLVKAASWSNLKMKFRNLFAEEWQTGQIGLMHSSSSSPTNSTVNSSITSSCCRLTSSNLMWGYYSSTYSTRSEWTQGPPYSFIETAAEDRENQF